MDRPQLQYRFLLMHYLMQKPILPLRLFQELFPIDIHLVFVCGFDLVLFLDVFLELSQHLLVLFFIQSGIVSGGYVAFYEVRVSELQLQQLVGFFWRVLLNILYVLRCELRRSGVLPLDGSDGLVPIRCGPPDRGVSVNEFRLGFDKVDHILSERFDELAVLELVGGGDIIGVVLTL